MSGKGCKWTHIVYHLFVLKAWYCGNSSAKGDHEKAQKVP